MLLIYMPLLIYDDDLLLYQISLHANKHLRDIIKIKKSQTKYYLRTFYLQD